MDNGESYKKIPYVFFVMLEVLESSGHKGINWKNLVDRVSEELPSDFFADGYERWCIFNIERCKLSRLTDIGYTFELQDPKDKVGIRTKFYLTNRYYNEFPNRVN